MRDALLIASGGAVGSVLRWLLASAVHRGAGVGFPWGTLVVNVLGSFAIGWLGGLAMGRGLSTGVRVFLVTGVLGGFTTFSAFSWENLSLLREGRWFAGAAYIGGSVAIGLAAALAGLAVANR